MKLRYSFLIGMVLSIIIIVVFKFGTRESYAMFNYEFEGMALELTPVTYVEKVERIKIGMIGDVLLHSQIYKYQDFSDSFREVEAELQSLDFLLANVESMPGGVELGLSKVSQSNSPAHIIRDLQEAGVDMVSLANNHSFDKGEHGLLKAIENVKSYEMPYVGAYSSPEDANEFRVVNVGGVDIGVLAYTYGINGFQLPTGKEHLVSWIDVDKMKADVAAIREKSDLVVMSIHWGQEYLLEPHESQIELAKQMADAGVDVIFGHHPHVVEPYELVKSENGHETHVFYSLGNFFSAQPFEYTNVGGIGSIEIERKIVSGKEFVKVLEPDFYPTAVVIENDLYKVVPLTDGEDYVGVSNDWMMNHMGL